MVKLVENDISVEEYLGIRARVNWRVLSDGQARLAIEKSLFIVKAVDELGNVLGMGRIVGDGAVISYVQDLMVIPSAQGKGIGSMLLARLKEFVLDQKEEGTTMMFCLMCAKGRESFYEQYGFVARPTDILGPGMIQYI